MNRRAVRQQQPLPPDLQRLVEALARAQEERDHQAQGARHPRSAE